MLSSLSFSRPAPGAPSNPQPQPLGLPQPPAQGAWPQQPYGSMYPDLPGQVQPYTGGYPSQPQAPGSAYRPAPVPGAPQQFGYQSQPSAPSQLMSHFNQPQTAPGALVPGAPAPGAPGGPGSVQPYAAGQGYYAPPGVPTQYRTGYYTGPTTSLQPQQLESVATDEDPVYGPLGRARGKIERAIVGDNEISPDLADVLVHSNESPYVPPPTNSFRPVKVTKSTPLPDALHQELNFKHQGARMGLFEEIGRAWFTVENKLFLWDYADGREFSRYDEQSESIQTVGLVRARKDVFVDDITHILVICTRTRVSLLGLSSKGAEISLYHTNLSIEAPATMTDVRGNYAGRVFLLGANKDLYELEYSSGGGWLSGGSKAWLTNRSSGYLSSWVPTVFSNTKEGIESFVVDPNQGRLFARHTRGEIEYFDVSAGKFESRARYTNLRLDFSRISGAQAQGGDGNKVAAIAIVGAHESKKAWLVAISSSGARIYLGAAYFTSSSLQVLGHRPPPPNVTRADAQSIYSSGSFVIASHDSSAADGPSTKLTFVTTNCGRQAAMRENYENFSPALLQEWVVTETVPAQVCAIVEAPSGDPARSSPSLKRDDGIGLSALPRQTASEPRTFIVLAASGVFWAQQTRPIDLLPTDIAVEKDTAIAHARAAFGRIQVAAMGVSLGAIAAVAPADPKHADAAAAASAIVLAAEPPVIRAGATAGSRSITYSPRHDGLALAMARALRPVWSAKVTLPAGPGKQALGIAEKTLLEVQGRLDALTRYTESYPFPRHQADGEVKLAWDQEELSLHGLYALLKQSVEAISFVLLLSDYKLPDVIAKCDPQTQSTLASLTFQSLLTSSGGRDVAKRLVTALIEQQIGQDLGIDTLTEILQQRCGTFCQPGDVVLHKAEEALRRAESARDPVDRSESLADSLRLFSRAASSAASSVFPRLPDISNRYRALADVHGSIELPLGVAAELDPSDRARDYVRDGRNPGDLRKVYFDQRQECYKFVIEALAGYDEKLDKAVAAGTADMVTRARDEAYALAIASDDELFHFYLYDWHVSRGRSDQLLEFDTPFIEPYLQLTASNVEDRRDLLWKFYARREEYLLAARSLADLATRPSGMSLQDRIYYLAQALTSAKSATMLDSDDVEFTTGLQERVDVAQVQIEVVRAVEGHPEMTDVEKRVALDQLNADLLGLDEMYQNFARPLRLYEPILLILKTADARVEDVVEAVWRQLLQPLPVSAVSGGGTTAEAILADRVTDLCRKYYPSEGAPGDIVIPVVYEQAQLVAASGAGGEAGWATRALLSGGVGLRDLWDAVVAMHDEAQEREFFAEEAAEIATRWVETRDGIPPAEIERFASAYLLRTGAVKGGDERRVETKRRMVAAKTAAARF